MFFASPGILAALENRAARERRNVTKFLCRAARSSLFAARRLLLCQAQGRL